ncbi:hypothetical protein LshimejAT787_0305120 [Lyophyllum shimeji]|uniref:Uncharacterized protein n=1 Tax=Lyophyllum shimeji TaxID=47721 RepID=A0A9P3PIT7_LYOSH|nr:hypothetical protein LshimejAT787_0305120 [Lyophyllum shimeji]
MSRFRIYPGGGSGGLEGQGVESARFTAGGLWLRLQRRNDESLMRSRCSFEGIGPTEERTFTEVRQTPGVDDVNIFDSDGEDDIQDTSEIDAILDELQSGELKPTLTREGAEDVALDTDKVYDVEVDDIEVSSGSEDEEDTGDEGDNDFVF